MADEGTAPCCGAARGDGPESDEGSMEARSGNEVATPTSEPDPDGTIRLPGGEFRMGTDDEVGFPEDGEGPARTVEVSPFAVDATAVTNAEFLEFVRDTDYTTDAERYGWSFVFESFLDEADRSAVIDTADPAPWWVAVEGACWYRPEGPSSNALEDRLDHPVVHVSHQDAEAYCEWAGKRLPTEAEWEYAARGGLEGKRYAWGDEFTPDGEFRCNTWQGSFPEENTGEDGYLATAPADAFPPNGYGLYNVAGNVWEWCADWFSADFHTTEAYSQVDPTGPETGTSRVMRGGSYLCHESWCNRYRVAARSKNTPDSSTGNIGFRCVADLDS